MTSLPDRWPEGVDVLLLPEVYRPGDDEAAEALRGRGIYPMDQLDIAKLLQAAGLSVAHLDERDDRARLARKADDIWMGVLVFAYGAFQNGAGDILADVVRRYIGPLRFSRARVHGRVVSARTEDGSYRELEVAGLTSDEFLEALRIFSNEECD